MQEPDAQCSCGSSENNKSEVNKKKIIDDNKLPCNPNQIANDVCVSKCSVIPVKATKTEELICSCKLKDSNTDINSHCNQWKAEGENINFNTKQIVEKSIEIKVISEVPENKQPDLEKEMKKSEDIEISELSENKTDVNSTEKSDMKTFESLECCSVEKCDSVISEIPKVCSNNQKSRVVIKIRLNDLLKNKPHVQKTEAQRETIQKEIPKTIIIENTDEVNTDVKFPEQIPINISENKIKNIIDKESKKSKYYYTKDETTLLDNFKKLFKTKIKKKKSIIFSQPPEKKPENECSIKIAAWEKHDLSTCSGDEKYTYIGEILFPICSKQIFYQPPGVSIRKSMKSYTINDPNKFGKTELVNRIYAYTEKIIPYEIVTDDEEFENNVNSATVMKDDNVVMADTIYN